MKHASRGHHARQHGPVVRFGRRSWFDLATLLGDERNEQRGAPDHGGQRTEHPAKPELREKGGEQPETQGAQRQLPGDKQCEEAVGTTRVAKAGQGDRHQRAAGKSGCDADQEQRYEGLHKTGQDVAEDQQTARQRGDGPPVTAPDPHGRQHSRDEHADHVGGPQQPHLLRAE